MPWNRTNPTKERVKFALEWEKRWNEGEGRTNVSQLCREFGISRETGPRKLRAYLLNRNPGVSFSSESAIASILLRNGVVSLRRRKRQRRVVPATRPFAAATVGLVAAA